MIDGLINESKQELIKFLKEKYKIEVKGIQYFENFINEYTKGSLSLKFWLDSVLNTKANEYFVEIISNLNQSLLLSSLGFHIPSTILQRRSLENILAYIYYKDHGIEFIKKELDVNKRNFDKIEELHSYIKDFPFEIFYQELNQKEIKALLEKIIEDWKFNYKQLSNYVHSSNTSFLEMNLFMDSISHSKDKLDEIINFHGAIISLINCLLVLFFFDTFSNLEDHKKMLIRSVISDPLTRSLKVLFTDF